MTASASSDVDHTVWVDRAGGVVNLTNLIRQLSVTPLEVGVGFRSASFATPFVA
jgi:hypothetical protein